MEEFAYIASHDLQEPLRTVNSFVDLLHQNYEDRLDAEGKEYLSYIYQSTTRMSELIRGLLDYSRLGKHKAFELTDCDQIVQHAIDDLHAAIGESHATVTYDRLPVIRALPSEMQQLFLNLIGNAIKFRKKDIDPVIHISAQQIDGGWQFRVSDNGIGIEAKNAAKIFILFQRLHNRDQYPGTGIGLSYCKKIVELHQGTLRVESVPGQGSDFFFTISSHLK
jgi:light-regulated signal transduction histidine kinase (bacteriophytochrome)